MYLEPMMVKNHCLWLLSLQISTSLSCTWLFGSPYLCSSHTWEKEEEWEDLIKSGDSPCTPHNSSHFCPHITASRENCSWECGAGSFWGLCLERRRRKNAPWGWSKQTVYARRKSWPLLVMPQRRKEDAIFDPLALTFQVTCTPENSAQMSIGIGLGRIIPGWRLRQVEEHPGFLHSHMPYGSHQHSEGLPTRLLQVHRTIRKALERAVLEMIIIEPPV